MINDIDYTYILQGFQSDFVVKFNEQFMISVPIEKVKDVIDLFFDGRKDVNISGYYFLNNLLLSMMQWRMFSDCE